MRFPQGDHRRDQAAAVQSSCQDAGGGVRINDVTGVTVQRGHFLQGFVIADRVGVDDHPRLQPELVGDGHLAAGFERCHQRAHRLIVMPVELPEETFKVGKNRQVHGRRQRLVGSQPGVVVLQKQLMQCVVLIGRNDHLGDRQAHFLRNVTGIYLGKTRGGHAETNQTLSASQLQHGVEIKHQLRQHTDPVAGVETDCLVLRAWPLPEQPVHDGLALIEATVDRERVDIRVSHRLQMLQLILWYAGCRIEHHHDGVVTVLERLDGRQPGITVGSPEHHRASLAFVQKILPPTAPATGRQNPSRNG